MTTSEYNICVSQIGPNLLRFINSNLKNIDASKDVVQETFIVLWIKKENVEIKKEKSFLFSTAYHKLIDHIRKTKKSTNLENINITSSDDIFKTLRDLEGYNYQEIETITNLSKSKVKVYLFRARKELKNIIQKWKYLMKINNTNYEKIMFKLLENEFSQDEAADIIFDIERDPFLNFEWKQFQKSKIQIDLDPYEMEEVAFWESLQKSEETPIIAFKSNRFKPFLRVASILLLGVIPFLIYTNSPKNIDEIKLAENKNN